MNEYEYTNTSKKLKEYEDFTKTINTLQQLSDNFSNYLHYLNDEPHDSGNLEHFIRLFDQLGIPIDKSDLVGEDFFIHLQSKLLRSMRWVIEESLVNLKSRRTAL